MVELSVQLDRAGCGHDIGRLIDTDDLPYRVFLRAKLERHRVLQREDEKEIEKQRRRGG